MGENGESAPGMGLWRRRVPHIVGLYLAGSYTAYEITQALVEKLELSPRYEDYCLFGLLSMLPTVAVLAWTHGAPGRDRWTRLDKVTIPINLVATTALLWMLPKPATEETASVAAALEADGSVGPTAQADPGPILEVPAERTSTPNLLFFALSNTSEEESLEFWGHALPLAIQIDIEQSDELTVHGTHLGNFSDRMNRAGFVRGQEVPLALMKEIADDSEYDFFARGQILGPGHVSVVVYQAQDGSEVATLEVKEGDMLAAVDSLTKKLREDFGAVVAGKRSTQDLPIAELGSSKAAAWKALSEALTADAFDKDIDRGLAFLDQAIAADPAFAFAHFYKVVKLIQHSKFPQLPEAVIAAQVHSYRLSEVSQFVLRVVQLWLVEGEPQKAIDLCAQYVERFPRDVTARHLLTNLYLGQGRWDQAIAQLESLLEFDEKRTYHLTIAELEVNRGQFAKALEHFDAYIQKYPEDAYAHSMRSTAALLAGDADGALASLQKATTLDPGSVSLRLRLVERLLFAGNVAEADNQLARARQLAQTDKETVSVLAAKARVLLVRGRPTAALSVLEEQWALQKGHLSAEEWTVARASDAPSLAKAGLLTQAEALVEASKVSLAEQQTSPLAYQLYTIEGQVRLIALDREGAEEALARVREISTLLGVDGSATLGLEAGITALKGDKKAAIEELQNHIAKNPRQIEERVNLGTLLRKSGRAAEAVDEFQKVLLSMPAHPEAHCELAEVLQASDTGAAAEHREKARVLWGEAEDGFAPAQKCLQEG